MGDDARIARLTELARRVPEWASIEVRIHTFKDAAYVVRVNPHGTTDLLAVEHPCALDALEAALLVLAGEPSEWQQLADQHMEAKNEATARVHELESMVEQLAAEWERSMAEDGPLRCVTPTQCAAKLRERAKGGG